MARYIHHLSLSDYQALFESTHDLYLILNNKLEVLEVNPTFSKITGLTPVEVLGKGIYQVYSQMVCDFSHQEEALSTSFEKVLSTQSSDTMPVQKLNLIPHSQNKEKTVSHYFRVINTPILDKDHKLNYIIHRMENVTEIIHFLANEKIRITQLESGNESLENLELFKLLEQHIKDYAFFLIDLDGKVIHWTACAERMLGYQVEEVLGKSFHLFFKSEDVTNHLPESELQLVKQDGHRQREEHLVKKDGNIFSAEVTLQTIQNSQGEVNGYAILIRNLTALKQIEKIKNQFISRVSHELRTPLTSILGAIDVIMHQEEQLSEKTHYLLQIALNNATRLSKALNDILSIETLETDRISLNFKDFDLDTVISNAITQSLPQAKLLDIKMLYNKFDGPLMLTSDPLLLTQALVNIISNGIKFSHKGRSITITVEKKDHFASILISDKGVGIPEFFKEDMYQKFSQSENISSRKFEGLGIGLNISKKIIEKLGGKLSFENRPSGGAIFTLTLPIERKSLRPDEINTEVSFLIYEAHIKDESMLKTLLLKNRFKHIMFARNPTEMKKIMGEYHTNILMIRMHPKFNATDNITLEIEKIIKDFHLEVIARPLVFSKDTTYLCLMLNWNHQPFDSSHLYRTVKQLIPSEYYHLPKILQVSEDLNFFLATQHLLLGKANIIGTTTVDKAKECVTLHKFELVLLDAMLSRTALELLSESSKMHIPVRTFTADDVSKGTIKKAVFKEISIPRVTSKEFS